HTFGERSTRSVMAMNCPRPYDTAPPRNARFTRNSGDTSSTHIMADVLKTERDMVLVNTRITSAASITLRMAMTTVSIACSQRGMATSVSTGVSAGGGGERGADRLGSPAGGKASAFPSAAPCLRYSAVL